MNRIEKQKIIFKEQLPSFGITTNEEYVGAKVKLKVRCVKCAYEWKITPNKLRMGRRCPKCRLIEQSERQKDHAVSDRLRERGYQLLGDYVNARTPVEIKCNNGHIWKGLCDNILNKGQGCPKCAKYGFKKDKPAILYYIQIDEKYFKIGVTNNNVHSRYRGKDNKRIKILFEKRFERGEDAARIEKEILKKYKSSIYTGKKLLNKAANREIFTEDVLKDQTSFFQ